MADDYRPVDEGVIEVRYSIFEYKGETDSVFYDWKTQGGESSDVWFNSIQEAVRDLENHFG